MPIDYCQNHRQEEDDHHDVRVDVAQVDPGGRGLARHLVDPHVLSSVENEPAHQGQSKDEAENGHFAAASRLPLAHAYVSPRSPLTTILCQELRGKARDTVHLEMHSRCLCPHSPFTFAPVYRKACRAVSSYSTKQASEHTTFNMYRPRGATSTSSSAICVM